VAAARCSSGGAVHLDLTGLSICTVLGTDIRSSVDSSIPNGYALSRPDSVYSDRMQDIRGVQASL
jgi:hypothetical protein